MIGKGLLAAVAAIAALALMGASPPACRVVVPGAVLSQGFGCTPVDIEPVDPTCPTRHFHSGVDLAARAGTPVYAAVGGAAAVTDSPTGYGLHVVTVGSDGLVVIYAHLLSASVRTGAAVEPCEVVGQVGSSGHSTGPHLHFEVRRDGRPVDPSPWLELAGGHQPGR